MSAAVSGTDGKPSRWLEHLTSDPQSQRGLLGACAWVEFVSILLCTAPTLLRANLRYFPGYYCVAQLQKSSNSVGLFAAYSSCTRPGIYHAIDGASPNIPFEPLESRLQSFFFSSLASLKFSLRAAACTVDLRISKIESSPEQATHSSLRAIQHL
jgi:hypothetical protein